MIGTIGGASAQQFPAESSNVFVHGALGNVDASD